MHEKKTFAFKLAQKHQVKSDSKNNQWKAREGISVAGCSMAFDYPGLERFSDSWGRKDQGMPC